MKTKEEFAGNCFYGEIPVTENVIIYYPDLIETLQEYAEQQSVEFLKWAAPNQFNNIVEMYAQFELAQKEQSIVSNTNSNKVSTCPRCHSNKIAESEDHHSFMDCNHCGLTWAN